MVTTRSAFNLALNYNMVEDRPVLMVHERERTLLQPLMSFATH